ncbi:transcription elongation factor a protein 2 [Phtheirospermum japonicum]|uniref:Transcription elongation factor n=1 Tax=Phtheirospermum japonicum TaxID=374723 RepID=A0A830BZX7_9LAMI|nr:transcription elongation factor a protein 2 [Phtheirospermum japonicum]
MEKELTELFELVKRAADASVNSPGEEDRCLDALKRLKKFPVNYQVLVSTQVGKRLRQLTKHSSDKIKTVASDVVEIWKGIIVKETTKAKKNGSVSDGDSGKAESADTETNNNVKNIQRSNSIKSDQNSAPKKLKPEKTSTAPNPDKPTKIETSTSAKIEKSKVVQTTTSTKTLHVETKVKVEKSSSSVGPPKLTSLVYCKDSSRDRVREILAEALCKVPREVNEPDLKERVNESDPYRVAVMVETTMFEKWGKSTGPQKFKYRSVIFNIKDQNNPDFRRKVLIGDIEPRVILELTPEEMASDARQEENAQIKQKALFNSERAAAPKASTNEFTCGRCKKKETTYYQMQTRSADEPMTTFVTCVNCNNHWKFC